MTDDQHGEGTPRGGGRWDPLPQGEYDDGATAFVQLPEGGIDALQSPESPLAAPGQGYVPPQITVAPATTAGTDPAATGTWAVPGAPADGTGWHDPQAGQDQQDPQAAPQTVHDRYGYTPGATGQWAFDEAAAGDTRGSGEHAAPGQDVTGQWSIPVARGDLPDESGEFTTSALVEQWGGTPPATLPGGAPAPWAPAPEAIGTPWGPGVPGVPQDDGPGSGHDHGETAGRPPYGEPAASPPPARPQADAAHGAPAGPAAEPGRPGDPASPARPDTAPGQEPPEHARPDARETAEPAPGTPEGPEGHRRPDEAPEARADGAGEARGPAAGSTAPAARAQDADGPRPADAASDGPDAPEGQPEPAPDADAAGDGAPGGPHDDHPLASYVLRVNGTDRPVTDAWIGESLLYVLRERLGLAGAKDGCSQGECGACNVQVDGRLVASCLVPAVTAAGSEVRTVEGLAQDGRPSDVQRALARCGAVQCGFCVPGMAMTVHDLLEGNPAPTELETRQALCGNLCRCSGYRGVVDAVREVVAEREAHSAPPENETEADDDTPSDTARIPHQAGPGAGGVDPSAYPGPGDQPHGQDGGQA
ncbi:2Fe-2S iron-sulfur cluster-binding protein [Streptomyces sp. NPDC101219]|uniref:2Fe-2S iron-sulfur cluster-binding protein n=1 Tax=Streptomyces sp. NPDC101219 TaxID=3366131 RepID=UPI00381A2ED4